MLLLALGLSRAPAQIAPELQEQGVLYFDGNLPNKVTATIHSATTVYLHRDFQMALAALYSGQKVELIGMSPEGYLLKTTYRNNAITGWIHPEDLPTGVDPTLFEEAKKNQEHRDAVNVAITNKNVIQGMTPEEVKQSVGRAGTGVDPHRSQRFSDNVDLYHLSRRSPVRLFTRFVLGGPFCKPTTSRFPLGN